MNDAVLRPWNVHVPLAVGSLLGALLLAMGPGPARAQTVDLTAEQVREAFVGQGYTVQAASADSDAVVVLRISEANTDDSTWPVLRAFVYPNLESAAAAHRRALAQADARLDRPLSDADDRGPQLLSGYGASAWRGNVALVQRSSPVDDPGAFPVEPNCIPLPFVTEDSPAPATPLPTTFVDPHFLALLDAQS